MSPNTKSAIIAIASVDGVQGLNPVVTGQAQQVACDLLGHLWAVTLPVTPGPTPVRQTTGAVAELQTVPILPGAGQQLRLRWAGVSLAGGAGVGRVLMVFDSAIAVVDGAIPIWRAPIGDNGVDFFNSVDVEFESPGGIVMASGIVLALSTTLDTLTLPGAAEGFFQSVHTNE